MSMKQVRRQYNREVVRALQGRHTKALRDYIRDVYALGLARFTGKAARIAGQS